MLREGWKNILDCLMTLYRARLLPQTFTEVEDFLHPDGKVKLVKEYKNLDSRLVLVEHRWHCWRGYCKHGIDCGLKYNGFK